MAANEAFERETISAGKESRHRRMFVVDVTTPGDTASAVNQVKAHPACPTAVSADGYTLRKRAVQVTELPGTGTWFLSTVSWSHEDASQGANENDNLLEPDDEESGFRFTGRPITVFFGKNTAYGPNPPDLQGGINVDEKGNVRGVEVLESHGVFDLTRIMREDQVTNSWIRARGGQVGTCNAGTYYGFTKKELLLTDFSGRRENSGNWKIRYSFEISRTRRNFDVAGIQIAEKLGWDYIHVFAQKQEDPAAFVVVPEVLGVYVADIIRTSNFSLL